VRRTGQFRIVPHPLFWRAVKWASEKVKPHVCGGVPTDWRDIGVVVASERIYGSRVPWRRANGLARYRRGGSERIYGSRVPYIPLYDSIPLACTVLLASRTLLLKF
jgi:hypothetical protein